MKAIDLNDYFYFVHVVEKGGFSSAAEALAIPKSRLSRHDFLWRTTTRLPERGRIGVFNRSYYEEVLVVKVHPEILKFQKLPNTPNLKEIWNERYDSIRDFEKHLARNGTVVLKFWLNVSKQEQCNRFLSRIDEPEKNWKFSEGDIKERGHWDDYMTVSTRLVALVT